MPSLVERLRRYDDQLGGLPGEAADRIERLLQFIRDRVADRSTMMKGGYHARRVCLEAEKLLRDEYAEESLKEGDGEQQAMRWLLSEEAACLPNGEARRIVRERWGNDVDAALQRTFGDPM